MYTIFTRWDNSMQIVINICAMNILGEMLKIAPVNKK